MAAHAADRFENLGPVFGLDRIVLSFAVVPAQQGVFVVDEPAAESEGRGSLYDHTLVPAGAFDPVRHGVGPEFLGIGAQQAFAHLVKSVHRPAFVASGYDQRFGDRGVVGERPGDGDDGETFPFSPDRVDVDALLGDQPVEQRAFPDDGRQYDRTRTRFPERCDDGQSSAG